MGFLGGWFNRIWCCIAGRYLAGLRGQLLLISGIANIANCAENDMKLSVSHCARHALYAT
jgi:hypothetical protein